MLYAHGPGLQRRTSSMDSRLLPRSRCVLSVLCETRHGISDLPATMQVFVDDPWIVMQGDDAQRARMTAAIIGRGAL